MQRPLGMVDPNEIGLRVDATREDMPTYIVTDEVAKHKTNFERWIAQEQMYSRKLRLCRENRTTIVTIESITDVMMFSLGLNMGYWMHEKA